jgi:hypothetical protein
MVDRNTLIFEITEATADGKPAPDLRIDYKRVRPRRRDKTAEPHQAWLRYFRGEWTYEWTSEAGDFSEKGQFKVTPAAQGRASIARIVTAEGAQEIEVAGWQPKSKALVFTGYSSNGGCWQVRYTEISENTMSGSGHGVLPDGRSWEQKCTLTRKDANHIEIRAEGTAEGEKLITIGKLVRNNK